MPNKLKNSTNISNNINNPKNENMFPLSVNRSIRGSRRLVREKVLQILVSHAVSETSINKLFEHIFFREYKQDDDEQHNAIKTNKILSPEEVRELDADTTIIWREEEITFAKNLINATIKANDYVVETLRGISENWGYDRISIIDKTLITIAIAEFIYCEDVPVKVSINEAIDISKLYSTEKSTQFINGILDKALNYLIDAGK